MMRRMTPRFPVAALALLLTMPSAALAQAEEQKPAAAWTEDGGPFPTGDIGGTLYTEPAPGLPQSLEDRYPDNGGVTIYDTPLSDPPPLPDRSPAVAIGGGSGYAGPMIDLGGPGPVEVTAPMLEPLAPMLEPVAPATSVALEPVMMTDPAPIIYDAPVVAAEAPMMAYETLPMMVDPMIVDPVPVAGAPVMAAPVMIEPYAAPMMADPFAAPVMIDGYSESFAPAPAPAARKPGAAAVARMSGAGPEMSMRSYGRSIVDSGGSGMASQNAIVNVSKAAVVKLPAGAKEVVVSDPTVVSAILRTARQTVLIGLKVGQTNAFFFDEAGGQILNLEIRVEPDLRPLQATLEETFPGLGLSVEALLGEVILRGRAGSPAESQRIVSIVQRYIAAARASSSEGGAGAAAGEIEVVNRLAVAGEDQVLLKVRIAEMKRSVVKQFGVDWSVTGDIIGNLAAGAGGFTSSSSFGVNGALLGGLTGNLFAGGDGGGLNTLIKAFERHGLVRILAEPTLTAVTGETASFLAGGQFPFPVSVENGQVGFEFRDFGVALEFAPVVLDGGRISLRIATEVSELTSEGSLSTTGGITIPGISVRRANTVVELPSGGTMAMAGLIQQKDSADHAGLPGLKNLPVLGQLFSSSDFKRSETELVILVTPYVATHGQERDFQLPTEGVPPPSDADFYLLGRLHAVYGTSGGEGDYATAREALHAPLGFILD